MIIATKPELHSDIAEAISDVELLTQAMEDAIAAMMRFAVIGRSSSDAITQLERLRQQFERLKGNGHDR